ncbi:MAG: hypothetical protein F6K47_31735 [Symploca sp. SIO2E6]|nr:hypothetical protein [Symploca sp. SIO2E6]
MKLERGFLPSSDPIESLGNEFRPWESLANSLPKVLVAEQLHSYLAELPTIDVSGLTSPMALERAMLILSYLSHAYIWTSTPTPTTLPSKLAIPWAKVAAKLQRPPVLSYASYTLHNWKRLDKTQPVELGNIVLLQNFLGGIDEEWFILVHVDIEAKAAPIVQSMPLCLEAIDEGNLEKLETNLNRIYEALQTMCNTLERMPEHCDPYIYFNRVRPYIHGWKANPVLPDGLIYEGVAEYHNQPQKLRGETGAQSSIIPSMDAFLSIEHEHDILREYLMEMRDYMPLPHREYIAAFEGKLKLRDYIQDKRLERPELKMLYNEIVLLVDKFRDTHLNYAAQYIYSQIQSSEANPSKVGTGGTPFLKYLKKHKVETTKYLIN